MVERGDSQVVALARHLLDNRWARLSALRILGELRAVEALDDIRHLVENSRGEVREEALRTLTILEGSSPGE